MSTLLHVTLCFLVLAIGSTRASAAVITLDGDTTLGADPPHTNDSFVVVQGLHPPTIVTVVEGANLHGDNEHPIFDVYDDSVLTLIGGFAGDSRQRTFRLNNTSSMSVLGGEFTGTCELLDDSEFIMTGGAGISATIRADGQSIARINGGGVTSANSFGESRMVISDGDVGDARSLDNSTLIIHGGFFDSDILADGNSRALIAGGHFPADMTASGDATIQWRGGSLADALIAEESGRIDVYGTNLRFVFDQTDGNFLAGRLADGRSIRVPYAIRDQGQIILHEVPEPAACSLALAAVAAALAARTALLAGARFARPHRVQ